MQHCDAGTIAVRALGDAPGDSPRDRQDDAHLAGCALCQSRLDELRAIVATCRSVRPEDAPVPPPPRVWSRISAEVAGDGATVVPLRRRRRPSLLAVAACAAALAVGAVGTAIVARPSTGSVIARTDLRPLTAVAATGTARLLQDDGRLVLALDVRGLPPAGDAYYEVWVMDPAGTTPLAVGVLGGSSGRYVLPPSATPARFPVVDVSREPLDSNPAHSADSLVRGTLPAA